MACDATLSLSEGTLNSVGYSLSGEMMDLDGDMWQPPEGDPAENQESSAPFRITPYHPGVRGMTRWCRGLRYYV